MTKVEKVHSAALTSKQSHDINASNGDEPQNAKIEKCDTVDIRQGPDLPSPRRDLLDQIGALLGELSLQVDDLARSPFATPRPINGLVSRLWAQIGVVKAIVDVFVEDERVNGPS